MQSMQDHHAALERSERVRQYVAGQLAPQACAEFEIELLGSAELQDLVEAELLLREHAAALPPATVTPRWRTAPAWGMAAALLLALGLGYGAGRFSGAGPEPEHNLDLLQFTAERGATADGPAAPAGRPFVARFLTADDLPHQLQLLSVDGTVLRTWRALVPAADGYITVLCPALEAGRAVQFELRGGAATLRFPLQPGGHG